MRKNALRKCGALVLFLLLTAALLKAVDFLLVDDVHSYSRVMLQELYAQSGQIDTLFLGSSHCYRSVDPAVVDETLGTHSFNAGSSQQLPDGSYYMLREAAEQNPIKTVYLEMFYTGYNESQASNVPMACYLLTDSMRWNSPNRYQYLWEMGKMAALPDLLLPARHGVASPKDWLSLWKAKLTDGYQPGNYTYVTYPEEGELYRGNGFVYTEGVAQDGFTTLQAVNTEQPLSAFGGEYLTRIADYCREQGIRLVLFTAPLPSAYVANTDGYQAYVDELRTFAAKNKTIYWDFSLYRDRKMLGLGLEDFSDAHHLNGSGAEKFTAVLCDTIARDAAGEDTASLFCDTVEESLSQYADNTIFMADAAMNS